jgi:hypothetical protein
VPIAKHTHNATTKEFYKAFMTRHAFSFLGLIIMLKGLLTPTFQQFGGLKTQAN